MDALFTYLLIGELGLMITGCVLFLTVPAGKEDEHFVRCTIGILLSLVMFVSFIVTVIVATALGY